MSAPVKKGFLFKPKTATVIIQQAPPEMVDLPTPQEEAVSSGPSALTASTKAMFAKPAAAAAAAAAPKPKAAAAPSAAVAAKPKTALPAAAPVAPVAAAPAAPAAPAAAPVAAPAEEEALEAPPAPAAEAPAKPKTSKIKVVTALKAPPTKTEQKLDFLAKTTPELKKLGEGFLLEELEDPYVNPAPQAYVSETRRGFSKFIKMNYADFVLPPPGQGPEMQPGDKYPYQKFVREYMRQASPYRGLLVYHGLGSGKTCSAIAASEALFATASKKVIVMTPFSLRKNFLKEVSFCGFRHFRLLNYWTPLDKNIPVHRMFAQEILGLSEGYIRSASQIWVPDFDQKSPNYDSLSSEEQTEIRKQILSQLVWDAEKNPKGRIRFINYNGISAKKLKAIACDNPTFFDDAVIVVDEIHNLVRLMQGEIDPYLKDLPGKKRKLARETVTVDPWKPSLCGSETNYRRGYIFYRLLLSARRSKLIGLSGTPLINFPEEMGILANILHGYIPLLKGTIQQTGDDVVKAIKTLVDQHPNIDFVSVEKSSEQLAGTELTVTLLPDGIRKTEGGVERMPLRAGPSPTPTEIKSSLVEMLKGNGYTFRGEVTLTATPLLHPFGDEFRQDFLTPDGLEVKNKFVLGKRLTGLVSYYKGSRQDLMPAVAVDEVVRVPFSPFSQAAYSKIRLEEIDIEMQKKDKGAGGLGDVWGEVFDIGQMKQSSNYRMGSRQMCNFAFPTTVTRPRARNAGEEEEENVDDKDIIEGVTDDATPEVVESASFDFPELDADVETGPLEDEVSEEEEKRRILKELSAIFEGLTKKGLTVNDIEDKVEGGRQYFKVSIPIPAEKLALLDNEFKTLRFTPDGFSGVDGDDLNDDLAVLIGKFPAKEEEEEEEGEEKEEKEGGGDSDNEGKKPAFNKTKAKSLKQLRAEKKVFDELKAMDKQVKKQVDAKKLAPKETALEKSFRIMREEGRMPPALAVGIDASAAAKAAKATIAQQSAATMKAQDAFRAAKAAGASDEEALAAGAAAGAKEYPAIGEEREEEEDEDDYYEEPPKVAAAKAAVVPAAKAAAAVAAPKTIKVKEAMKKKKEATAAKSKEVSMNNLVAAFENPEKEKEKLQLRRDVKEEDARVRDEARVQFEALGAKPKKEKTVAPAAVQGKQLKCKGGIQENETYKQALQRAKDCLRTLAANSLRLSAEEDSLAKYSPKYAAILQRILDAPGSSLVYSQFLDMEGIGIFRLVMDINGFAPIEIVSTANGPAFTPQTEASLRKGPDGQLRYMTFSGEEKEDVRRMALDVFNARFDELPGKLKTVLQESGFTNNHTGQLARVFCITSAGAEGLSLKNVRAVHIMEPYWNDVRLKQVKGRAIRIGSHLELPEAQRNVSIYTYISIFSEDAQVTKAEGRIDETIRLRDNIDRAMAEKVKLPIPASAASYVMTSDERLFVISERKKKVIEELETVMKGAAVDCQLSAAENLDGTFQCLVLDKVVGDFVYEPDLKKDIAKSEYTYKEEARLVKEIEWRGVGYWAGADRDEKGEISGFSLYAKEDRGLVTPVGSTGAKDGVPAAPVKIF
jgi:hypothetical protein